jgi:asparagine synthase (glutamine-hydrolysing)
MSAICGIIQFDGAPVDSLTLRVMVAAAPHRGPDGVGDWSGASAGLAHLAFHVTPESVRETQPLVSADGRFVLVADARIDNRDELIAALRGEPDLPLAPTDADLILAAFRRWGETCPERLLGDFVFAVWDLAERRLLLVRDALGGRGLCYHFDGRRCLFASEVGQILDSPGWEARINEGKVADYLADLTQEQEETFFQSIYYVAPAHCLTITGQGVRKRRYWDIDPEARIRYRDDREYAEHLRERLTAATRCRMRSIGPIGLSLSGGLDSTLLAAIASGLLPHTYPTQSRLKTFSYVFDKHKASDEREYILPVAERHALDAHYLPCDDKWALKDLPRWPVERDYIWSDAYSWLVVAVAKAAQASGCRVLLSGLYGDELFLGGHYWATELLLEWRLGELFRLWRANRGHVSWRRDLIHHGLRQLLPAGLKRSLRRLKPRPAHHNPALHPLFAQRVGLPERARDDPRHRRFTQPAQWVRLSMLSVSTWPSMCSDGRAFYHRHGLESETPYFDRRLVEVAMALPADQLGRPWRGRWIQRNAMRGLLPEGICERPFKTDFEVLTRIGLFERETDTLRSILAGARSERMGFVRGDWIRYALSRQAQLDQVEIYWLWKIVSLELWLRHLAQKRPKSD